MNLKKMLLKILTYEEIIDCKHLSLFGLHDCTAVVHFDVHSVRRFRLFGNLFEEKISHRAFSFNIYDMLSYSTSSAEEFDSQCLYLLQNKKYIKEIQLPETSDLSLTGIKENRFAK